MTCVCHQELNEGAFVIVILSEAKDLPSLNFTKQDSSSQAPQNDMGISCGKLTAIDFFTIIA